MACRSDADGACAVSSPDASREGEKESRYYCGLI